MGETHFHHLSRDGQFTTLPTLQDALAALQGGGNLWLDYYLPSRDDLAALVEPFGLHPLAIEDCTDANQVLKIEDFERNTFILMSAFGYQNQQLSVDEVGLFIGDNFLITVSGHASEGRRPLDGLVPLMQREAERVRRGPAYMMHLVIDYVVDRKAEVIAALEVSVDEAEDAMMDAPAIFEPTRLLQIRRDLLNVRKSLFYEREILLKICRKDCRFVPDKAIAHFRDIHDHLSKFLELSETYREIVATLMEIYLSLLNNQMARSANRTNATVRRLTFITTIFMPLTLLAGIGGMSEWTTLTGGEANMPIAYALFLLGLCLIGVLSYRWLRHLDREESPDTL